MCIAIWYAKFSNINIRFQKPDQFVKKVTKNIFSQVVWNFWRLETTFRPICKCRKKKTLFKIANADKNIFEDQHFSESSYLLLTKCSSSFVSLFMQKPQCADYLIIFRNLITIFFATFFKSRVQKMMKSILIHEYQHKSTRIKTNQHESDTSQHESTRVWHE